MKSTALKIGGRVFEWGTRTYVMGILNITPDSFSGDGLLPPPSSSNPPAPPASPPPTGRGVWSSKPTMSDVGDAPLGEPAGGQRAIEQARAFVSAGVDILDVGGESTRPGSSPLTADEELERVLPVIRALRALFPDMLISIDTYKARVAEAAFAEGAHILNDVWGLRADPDLAASAARHNAPVILMHNRSNPASVEVRERLGNAYIGAEYKDLIEDVKRELLLSVTLAHQAGIPEAHIILDPGIGFGKSVEHNLELINRLDEIRSLGYPLLLGASRKSFIGFTLGLPADQRLEGTAAAVAVGIVRGADMIRVHDVEAMLRVARMTDALVRSNP